MQDYRRGAHSVFAIHLHIVWITKYRRPAITGEVALRVRYLIRELTANEGVTVMKGHVSRDHVHLFVSIPPQLAVSRLVQRMKGKTAYKLLQEFPHLRKRFWGRHLWARGYFVCSSGNVTDEQVKAYIENQDLERDEDFRVEGEGGP